MSGKRVDQLTRKQVMQLSGKKYKSKRKFLEWFDKDPLERLSVSALKNLARNRRIPFSGKTKKELFSLIKGTPPETLRLRFVSSSFLPRFNAFFDKIRITQTSFRDARILFRKIVQRVRRKHRLPADDMCRIVLSHPSWRRPSSTERLRFSAEVGLFENIARWAEYRDVPIEELEIEVISFRLPRGTGRLRATKDNLARKKSVICVKNSDMMCAARAVVTAVSVLNKDRWTSGELQSFRKSRKLQEVEALKLHQETGVPVRDEGNDFCDLKRFAEHLGVGLKVFSGGMFNEICFETGVLRDKTVCLLKNGNHFDVITSLPGRKLLGRKLFQSVLFATGAIQEEIGINVLENAQHVLVSFQMEKLVLEKRKTR